MQHGKSRAEQLLLGKLIEQLTKSKPQTQMHNAPLALTPPCPWDPKMFTDVYRNVRKCGKNQRDTRLKSMKTKLSRPTRPLFTISFFLLVYLMMTGQHVHTYMHVHPFLAHGHIQKPKSSGIVRLWASGGILLLICLSAINGKQNRVTEGSGFPGWGHKRIQVSEPRPPSWRFYTYSDLRS